MNCVRSIHALASPKLIAIIAGGLAAPACDAAESSTARTLDASSDIAPPLDAASDTHALDATSDAQGDADSGAADSPVACDAASASLPDACACDCSGYLGPGAAGLACYCALESCLNTLEEALSKTDDFCTGKGPVTLFGTEAGCTGNISLHFSVPGIYASSYYFDRVTHQLVGASTVNDTWTYCSALHGPPNWGPTSGGDLTPAMCGGCLVCSDPWSEPPTLPPCDASGEVDGGQTQDGGAGDSGSAG